MNLPRPLELSVFFVRLVLMIIWMIVASVIALPLALIRWRNPSNNRLFGDIYGPVARLIMGIRLEVEGWEHLTKHQPCIYVANHQSGVDMTTLEHVYPPKTVLIGKRELLLIPGFGLMYVAFGNILIDRKNRADSFSGLNQALDMLRKKGISIWLFPEGTRNKSGIGLLPFKKGAFHMAVEAQVPIVPVVCSSLAPRVNFERKYARGGTMKIRVLPAVLTAGKTVKDIPGLLETTRTAMLQALEEMNRGLTS